jgi:hypothetical protein
MDEVWAIEHTEMLDTYKAPDALGDVVWDADVDEPGRRWPLFHPSEADPDGGYRARPYTVRFTLPAVAPAGYALRVAYLTIAPRLAHLELAVNGVVGRAYLRPAPSASGEIRLLSGLHTAIYAEGLAEVILPAALLRPGANELALTARDPGEVLRVANPEAVKRLDRMANGAGLIYQRLSLARLPVAPAAPVAALELRPTVLYTRRPDGALAERCHLFVELAAAAAPAALRLEAAGCPPVALALPAAPFGHLRASFDLPDGPAPAVPYTLTGELGGAPLRHAGTLVRRRKWTVFVAPHAHTDIGYTHRQWEVAERLCRDLDAALDLLGPPGSPPAYAYHLDSSWALEHYLATRNAGRRRRLAAAVLAGQVGVPSNYVIPLTQLAGLEALIRNGELSDGYLRALGRRAEFAAVVDVASLTGSLPDLLAGSGVPYLAHANNQDRGPFRLNGGLHRRSPFFWEGQAGGRVLVWLAKMYCELRKVCGSPPVLSSAERGLDMWLDEYERPDYAPDAVLLYGQEADNTDIDPQPADFLRRWGAAYAFPRLVPCDVAAFFRYVAERFAAHLPTFRGDGGAYWEDGAGSGIATTMLAREAQAGLPAGERLEALAAMHIPGAAFPSAHYAEAWRQLLLFDEHTWGAFLSVSDPDALLQQDQWAVKEGFAREARQWAARLLHGAAARHSLSWNTAGREVVVYNPHSWPLGGPVRVEIGRGERAYGPDGAPVPQRQVQLTATQAVVELWLDPLPGLSYRRLALREAPPAGPNPAAREGREGGPGRARASRPSRFTPGPVLENDHYRLEIDPARGCVRSWYDKALGRELVEQAAPWGFGALLHAAGGEGTRLLSNQADLPDGDPQLDASFDLAGYAVEVTELGPLLTLRGRAPHGELTVEWLLPARAREAHVRFTYRKAERREREAVYVAFPLDLPGAAVRSDSQLGWVDWHTGQLPGGCKEWLPLQSAVLAEIPGAAALIASPDIPLFCVGDIVRGRWPKALDLTGGRIFSYVLNNYWHTNYRAAQGGPISWGYRLSSGAQIAPDAAFRFGWAARRPLFGQRISYQDFRSPAAPYDGADGGVLAHAGPAQVHLSALKPARHGPGWVARFQEIGGAARVATLAIPGRPIARACSADLLEHDGAPLPVEPDGSLRVPIPAWGLATVRFELG